MSILGDLVGSAADATPLGSILDIGSKLVDRIIPDPQAAAQAKLELAKLQASGELAKLAADTDLAKAQLAVDQTEAASPNWFASNWRPFVGWASGFAFIYASIFEPFITWLARLAGSTETLPHVDTSILIPVLLAMLGMGGMHMYENIQTQKAGAK